MGHPKSGSLNFTQGFPRGSDGKESAFNEGDRGLIPGWEDPLEESMATHSSILAQRNPTERGAWGVATVHGVAKRWTRLRWTKWPLSTANFT